MNMIVGATAMTGFPFAEDISPRCFTTMVFVDIPNKFNALVLVGVFLFVQYAGKLPVKTTARIFVTNASMVGVILGLCVCISGVEIALEDDVAYSILNQSLVAISNCLRPLNMVFIGLSLNGIRLENIAQVACVFLKRSSWILVGLYCYLAPSDTDTETVLAVLFFMNANSTIYVFLHLENVSKVLEQKIEACKMGDGRMNDEKDMMDARLQQVNNAIGCIMPLICYDFGFTVFVNILISTNKEWFTNGTNLMLHGLGFVIIGAVVAALGVYLAGNKLGNET